jgi:hypothetical protein
MDPSDSQYLMTCWNGMADPQMNGVLAIVQRYYITQELMPGVIGFTIYTIIFGDLVSLRLSFSLLTKFPSPFSSN